MPFLGVVKRTDLSVSLEWISPLYKIVGFSEAKSPTSTFPTTEAGVVDEVVLSVSL